MFLETVNQNAWLLLTNMEGDQTNEAASHEHSDPSAKHGGAQRGPRTRV